MKLQVLVATMNQTDHSLLKKMNIRSDVIVGNQCDYNLVEKFKYCGHDAVYLNFSERGVGLNRNNVLMRATGDICIFADDDMIYENNYVELITNSFNQNPKADVIIFNLIEKEPKRYIIKKKYRVNFSNYLRFGTARIAIRLKSIREKGIYFNQCFGGGTNYSHGEDNLFLTDCLRKRLKIYAIPIYIANLEDNRESTWFSGYDEKFFYDQGVLCRAISPKFWRLLCLYFAIKFRKKSKIGIIKLYKLMCK